QGDFAFEDSQQARGAVAYHLTAQDGSAATVDVQTHVAGKPTDLSVSAKPRTAEANTSVQVTAHLASPTTDRTVTLYAQPYQRSEEHTCELQSPCNIVCRLLIEKKKNPE